MERVDVPMPVVTEEGDDAVVTAWFVDEGGHCATGQLLAEVQAEKVASEVHAPTAGYVVDRVAINDPVPQGRPMCAVVDEVPAQRESTSPPPSSAGAERRPVRASPAAKRLARELGVDLSDVHGSGPDGRITEADVRREDGGGEGGSTALRQVIARNLRRSHAETVPVTLFTTVHLGAGLPDRITARVVHSAARALADHPGFNGRRDGDRFTPSDEANISIAIQTDDGLVAPVITDAGAKSIDDLDSAIAALAERARSKQLDPADYAGGTFSVSNLGGYGIDGFTPVINLPEIAILGVGTARRVATVDDSGSISPTHQMVLSLTFDHAFVDGAPAADFLRSVGTYMTGT